MLAGGAELSYHDPFIDDWELADARMVPDEVLETAVQDADLVVLLQNHDAYAVDALSRLASRLLDTRGVSQAAHAVRL